MTRRTSAFAEAQKLAATKELKELLDDSNEEPTDLEDLVEPADPNVRYSENSEDDEDYQGPKKRKGKAKAKDNAPKRPKKRKIEWTLAEPFSELSDELLIHIFSFIEPKHKTTQRFSQVSHRFRGISQSSYARSQWLLRQHHKSHVLYYAILLCILDSATLDSLVDSNRVAFSRYFAQMVTRAYSGQTPKWLPSSWGSSKRLSFGNWLAVLQKAYSLFGESMSAAKDSDDSDIIRNWIIFGGASGSTNVGYGKKRVGFTLVGNQLVQGSPTEPGASTPQIEWMKIKALFETYKFCPFSPKDSIDWMDAIMLRPEILDLLLAAEIPITADVAISVITPLLENDELDEDKKIEEMQRFRAIDKRLIPDKTCFADILKVTTLNPDRISLFRRISSEGLVDFEMYEVFACSLYNHTEKHGLCYDTSFFDQAGHILLGLQELGFSNPCRRPEANRTLFIALCFLTQDEEVIHSRLLGSNPARQRIVPATPAKAYTIATARTFDLDQARSHLSELDIHIPSSWIVRALMSVGLTPEACLAFAPTDMRQDEYILAAACSCLYEPSLGRPLKRLCRAMPGIRDALKQFALDRFSIDAVAVAKYAALGSLQFKSSLSMDHRNGYRGYDNGQQQKYYLPPPAEHKRPVGLIIPTKPQPMYSVRSSLAHTVSEIFHSSCKIKQLLLNHATVGGSSHLIDAALEATPAIGLSRDYFDLCAKAGISPPSKCLDIVKRTTYHNSMSKNRIRSLEPLKDLRKWQKCFNHLAMSNRQALFGPRRHRDSTFTTTMTNWERILRAEIKVHEQRQAEEAEAVVKTEETDTS